MDPFCCLTTSLRCHRQKHTLVTTLDPCAFDQSLRQINVPSTLVSIHTRFDPNSRSLAALYTNMSGHPNAAKPYPSELMKEYNGDSLRAIAILFIILTTVCVAIRFYARRVGNVKWGLDDSLIIPGTIFCLALCTCALGGFQLPRKRSKGMAVTDLYTHSRPVRQRPGLPRIRHPSNPPRKTNPQSQIPPRSPPPLPQRRPLPQTRHPRHLPAHLHLTRLPHQLLDPRRLPSRQLAHFHGRVFSDVQTAGFSVG